MKNPRSFPLRPPLLAAVLLLTAPAALAADWLLAAPETQVVPGQRFEVELTLSNRALLGFRMLLGREALRGRFVVDPGCSYRCGGRRSSFARTRTQGLA